MDFITIKSSHFESNLLILKSRLEFEGIPCLLKNQFTTQVMNYMPTFEVELQVSSSDLEKAKEIMDELEK
ncbi:MAG: DUF2007 domain-containing protein [Flavobacteriales bacterium]|nr:DUF2007 domain-containing protein [Flavobacteriia bacterium]NCP52840.1 DUF2007 domain-containing protein [Flavobacteriales bacterium]PIV94103.1 MAG: hypothetical protein COW44_05990 [Flavobacteriaceae bacterium CG17_big_fil_post_rev_8_21_14_2_50_33_15]PIY11752.1 MAG: hypothetical protein COZ17_05810 [Flavobacteriaceae bacterium CG_4_10_14_3_um_filter_33_47]PJB17278.1 MAG: hypothetical protein CO117_12300 [Flavobacteriaceae bacterium CG_4_9_14_3_um_filter_33_16]